MELLNSRRIMNIGVMAAIYALLNVVCAPLAFDQIQLRFSEMLMLLCFFNKDYIFSLTIGCFITNLNSPLGFSDVGFGTAATLAAAMLIYFFRDKLNLFVVSLFPVVINGFVVGAELHFINRLPFWQSVLTVSVGEFICVSMLGVVIISALSKKRGFMKVITAGTETE
ncbi:QueT transporter family protein [Ruminococcus sp.]|uniref:QueT transporter family protein n=1 Tax=Ruminococcus sp. TaxID=41978 RepID=UPI002589E50F|nr:QueT transporter family protein [Ruminococcus sp.]MCR5020879.1 QueT transporter family protein [Ruminococcus sp.]